MLYARVFNLDVPRNTHVQHVMCTVISGSGVYNMLRVKFSLSGSGVYSMLRVQLSPDRVYSLYKGQ